MRWTSLVAHARFYGALLLALLLLLVTEGARAQAVPAGQGLVADSTELRVLRQLYYATGGPNWARRDNWLQGTTLADAAGWWGVTVSGGDVTGFYSDNNNLQGALPAAFGQLIGLTQVQFSTCIGLTGALPHEIGQLTRLRTLIFHFTGLSGALPAELGNLVNLTYLSLYTNRFSGAIPPELGRMAQLQTLYLGSDSSVPAGGGANDRGNRFTGTLPPELGNLANLRVLDIDSNPMSGPVPAEWGRLTNLTSLELDGNGLGGAVPAEVLRLPQLQYLILGFSVSVPPPAYGVLNGFTGLPVPGAADRWPGLRLSAQNNYLDFGALEPYFTGPGKHMFGALDYRAQRPQPGADTVRFVPGQALTLRRPLGGARTHYQWQQLVGGAWQDVAGATGAELALAAASAADAGAYRVTATNDWVTNLTLTSKVVYALVDRAPALTNPPLVAACPVPAPPPAPTDRAGAVDAVNYVRIYAPRVPLTDLRAAGAGPADSVAAWPKEQLATTTQYLDGLGRLVQTVQHRASPLGHDVVAPVTYDALGRQSRQYLPYAANQASGPAAVSYRSNARREQFDFYTPQQPLGSGLLSEGVARTGVAYGETQFEASPLNRVLAQGAPGETWALGGGHTQGRTERPNTDADAVAYFTAAYGTMATAARALAYQGMYPAGALWMTETTDEQQNPTQEFKDKQGQVVAKKVGLAPGQWLTTGYVHDDFQRLRAVLPPKAMRLLAASGQQVTAAVDSLLFYYRYDGRGRPLAKQVPGQAGEALVVFDQLDRPVLTQDPAQRARREWGWTKYDALGRVVLTGLVTRAAPMGQAGYAINERYLGLAYEAPGFTAFDYAPAVAGVHYAASRDFTHGAWFDAQQQFLAPFGDGTAPSGAAFVRVSLHTADAPLAMLIYNGQVPASYRPYVDRAAAVAGPGDNLLTALTDSTAISSNYYGLAGPNNGFAAFGFTPVVPGVQYTGNCSFANGAWYDAQQQFLAPFGSGLAPAGAAFVRVSTQRTAAPTAMLVFGGPVPSTYRPYYRLSQPGDNVLNPGDAAAALQQEADALATAAAGQAPAAAQFEQPTTDAATQYYSVTGAYPRLGQDGFGAGQVLTAAYYDGYDFNKDGTPDLTFDDQYAGQFPSGQAPVADTRVTGLVTRTQTRVLGVADGDATQAAWLTSTTFYDDKARPVQVVATNARGATDVVTSQVDFVGQVLKSYAVHTGYSVPGKPGTNHEAIAVAETHTYDHAGRLVATRQQLPGEARAALVDSLHYNEVGQLLQKHLAPGTGLAQDVDYAYNIRGWLTGLNEDLVTGTTAAADSKDLWGMQLSYDCGFQSQLYNGNISGQQWRNKHDGVARAYGYGYDGANRLLYGDYVAQNATGGWSAEQQRFALAGLRYDENGNILALQRRGLLANARRSAPKQFGPVDNLSYAYAGNRLQAVNDGVRGNQLARPANYHGAPASLAGDFQEQGVRQAQEYAYDPNGSLTSDANKGISGIVYNHLSLPRQIHFGTGADSVVFRYSAAGQKVAKLVYQTGRSAPQRTDYLGPYQYEGDSLRFFPHAEGRVLRFVSKDPAGQATVRYEREYTLKDHLGNLRLAYRLGHRQTFTATLEQDDYTRTREVHQFDSLSVSPPVAQNVGMDRALDGSYVARLNAGGNAPQPLGPLKQLAVQKGDTITVTAPGYYPQPVANNSFAFSLAGFVASLLQQQPAPAPGLDGRRRGALPLLSIGVGAALQPLARPSGGVPQGYVRLLVFDADSNLVSQQVQTRQLSAAAASGYEPLTVQVVAAQDGYVTAYVGNESNADVYFDDVQIELGQGLQVQETAYDPAGLELAGLVAPAPGIKGLNNYRFNGKEFQADLGLNWNHQDWRFFNPQIFTWSVVDPEVENGQESMSPYAFGYDNAVRYADVNGRAPGNPPITAAGIITSTFYGLAASVANTVLAAADYSNQGGLMRMFSGQSYRATAGADGISYAQRPAVTSDRQALGYIGADALDMASTAVTVATMGEGAAVGRGLTMSTGLLFEQGAGKVAQNAVVQEGKALASSAGRLKIDIAEENKIARDLLNPPSKPGNAPTFKKTELRSKFITKARILMVHSENYTVKIIGVLVMIK